MEGDGGGRAEGEGGGTEGGRVKTAVTEIHEKSCGGQKLSLLSHTIWREEE